MGFFRYPKNKMEKINQSPIQTISFTLEDGVIYTSQPKEEIDVLINQNKCIIANRVGSPTNVN
jgi:hypothetical protein